jgi:hypothetical protein
MEMEAPRLAKSGLPFTELLEKNAKRVTLASALICTHQS